MKFNFKFNDITIADKVSVGTLEFGVQYSAEELVSEFALIKQIIKDIPEICADLGNGAVAFAEVDKAFSKYVADLNPETETSQNAGMDLFKSAINKIRTDLLSNVNVEQKTENDKAV